MNILEINPMNTGVANQPNPDPYYFEGLALLDLEKYPEAIDRFNKAISINPNRDEFWDRRGSAYLGLKNYVQSINDFSKAISLSPNNGFYYLERGLSYYAIGAMNEAISDFKSGAKLGDTMSQELLIKWGVKW